MEEELKPVTTELRIAHLNRLALGGEIVVEKKSKQYLLYYGITTIVVIAGIITAYEKKFKQQKNAFNEQLERERRKGERLRLEEKKIKNHFDIV